MHPGHLISFSYISRLSPLCSAQGTTINPPADGEADEEVDEDHDLAVNHLVAAMERREEDDHEASFHWCNSQVQGDLSQPLSLYLMLASGFTATINAHCYAL